MKNNIKLGSGQIYFKGLDEAIDISEAESTTEWADDKEYVKINTPQEFTITCDDLQVSDEWTLAYCKICGNPFPIIQFDALLYGKDNWTCPLCTVIERVKRGVRR